MAAVGGEDDLSMVIGAEGCRSVYSWNEVNEYLKGERLSLEKRIGGGGVFWSGRDAVSEKIASVLKRMVLKDGSLVQFWAVDRHHRHLTIREQPFGVGGFLRWEALKPSWFDGFRRGACWYRKACMEESEAVMVDAAAAAAVGRVYRSKQPESSPDLRLYSCDEFPLRAHAARCGYRGYLAVPVFDNLNHECVGVLEVLSSETKLEEMINATKLHYLLKEVELGSSTHAHNHMTSVMEKNWVEISSIIFSPIRAIPQVHLAQIWVPCTTCTNSSCMQRAEYKQARDRDADGHVQEYIGACSFHHQQMHYPNCSSSDHDQPLSISLAHYAHKARLSHRLLLCLERDDAAAVYVVEYFLDARCDSHLRYLLKIMEMKLKDSFRFRFCFKEEEEKDLLLGTNINLSELELSAKYCNFRTQRYGHSNFSDYLCETQPSMGHESGWVFCTRNSRRIQGVMKKIAAELFTNCFLLVQFWAPKMGQGRLYLETEEQPFALSYLDDGLTSYRKECTKHHYFVDEEAKPEELGPPGRVFRSGHMEMSPDLRLYSADEFPLRSHAVQCRNRPHYIALPVFEVDNPKCVGVLELVGFSYGELKRIRQLLSDAELRWSHIDRGEISRWLLRYYDYEAVLSEVKGALSMSTMIPQLCMAEAWLPYGTNSNDLNSCMELARVFTTDESKSLRCNIYKHKVVDEDEMHWSHVHTGKGILGMVLASENKSCFSPDLCDLGIAQEPLAHFAIQQRRSLCFAICLQSSLTGDLPYVLKFFLNPLSPSPTTYTAHHLHTFLKFLLPTLRLNLKTFHIASGKQLDEMVVDIIEFSQANIFPPFSDSDTSPFKFKRVPYGEHRQHTEDDQHTIQSSVVSVLKKSTVVKTHIGRRLIDFQKELGVGAGRCAIIKRVCTNSCNYERAEHAHRCDVLEEGDEVIVIVKHGDDAILWWKSREVVSTIIFETRLSVGVNKIRQEVASRLDLDAASLKLKFLDDENNKILLACDDDFKLCPMRRTPTGQPCIRLFAE